MLNALRLRDGFPTSLFNAHTGLPITVNAAWVATFVFISETPPRDRFSLKQGGVAALFLFGIAVFILLQVTNLRYPKPTKRVSLFALCVVLVLLFLWPNTYLAVRSAAIMILLGVAYIVFGPLFVKGVEVHKARKEARAAARQDLD